MVHVLSLFIFMFSIFANAAVTPSSVPSLTLGGSGTSVGGLVISESDTSYFTIIASYFNATTDHFIPFYKNGVAYQVTAGKTAKCRSMITQITGTSNQYFQLASATASVANDATSLTGGVYMTGAAGKYGINFGNTAGAFSSIGISYDFGASTFPAIQQGSSVAAQEFVAMSCKEI